MDFSKLRLAYDHATIAVVRNSRAIAGQWVFSFCFVQILMPLGDAKHNNNHSKGTRTTTRFSCWASCSAAAWSCQWVKTKRFRTSIDQHFFDRMRISDSDANKYPGLASLRIPESHHMHHHHPCHMHSICHLWRFLHRKHRTHWRQKRHNQVLRLAEKVSLRIIRLLYALASQVTCPTSVTNTLTSATSSTPATASAMATANNLEAPSCGFTPYITSWASFAGGTKCCCAARFSCVLNSSTAWVKFRIMWLCMMDYFHSDLNVGIPEPRCKILRRSEFVDFRWRA